MIFSTGKDAWVSFGMRFGAWKLEGELLGALSVTLRSLRAVWGGT